MANYDNYMASMLIPFYTKEIERLYSLMEAVKDAIEARETYLDKPSSFNDKSVEIANFKLALAAENFVDNGNFSEFRQFVCDLNGWNKDGYPVDDNYDPAGPRFGTLVTLGEGRDL